MRPRHKDQVSPLARTSVHNLLFICMYLTHIAQSSLASLWEADCWIKVWGPTVRRLEGGLVVKGTRGTAAQDKCLDQRSASLLISLLFILGPLFAREAIRTWTWIITEQFETFLSKLLHLLWACPWETPWEFLVRWVGSSQRDRYWSSQPTFHLTSLKKTELLVDGVYGLTLESKAFRAATVRYSTLVCPSSTAQNSLPQQGCLIASRGEQVALLHTLLLLPYCHQGLFVNIHVYLLNSYLHFLTGL